MPPDTHFKLHYIAQYEGRSANGQVVALINKCIFEFEKEHGPIPISNPKQPPKE